MRLVSQEDFDRAKSRDLIYLYCGQCNEPFSTRKNDAMSKLAKGIKNRYCSKKCHSDSMRKDRPTSFCLNCGKEAKNKFCSSSCSAIFTNPKRVETLRKTKSPAPPKPNCLFCNSPCRLTKAIYCSKKCHRAMEWENKKKSIEVNGVPLGTQNPTRVKRYLKETRGNCCEICKMGSWFEKEMPLVLDHIDGNSDAWSLSNLRLICPNCDTFTSFYKGRNRGNGRFKRRQRFLSGLSF